MRPEGAGCSSNLEGVTGNRASCCPALMELMVPWGTDTDCLKEIPFQLIEQANKEKHTDEGLYQGYVIWALTKENSLRVSGGEGSNLSGVQAPKPDMQGWPLL